LPELYEIIYRESTAIKPEVVLEMCPCGVFPSFYKMPFYNQPVASDPNSHWQLRHRAKVIKALMGAEIPFYGDHVERYYDQSSFASMIGIGAIPGSMFVDKEENRYKHPSKSVRSIALTPSRKSDFSKWMQIHETHQLSKGRYVNLYDLAYDKPETHVIRKEGDMYYSFYHENWDGEIEFRGLKPHVEYEVFDYVNDEVLGTLNREKRIRLKFKDYLLVKVSSGTKP
jgi:alpha-galactosidase